MFSKPDGKPMDSSSVTYSFRRVIKRAGLPSLMLKQGIHPKVLSERLGHSSIGISLGIYSHVMPGLQEAAALRFDEGLRQTAGQSIEKMLANG